MQCKPPSPGPCGKHTHAHTICEARHNTHTHTEMRGAYPYTWVGPCVWAYPYTCFIHLHSAHVPVTTNALQKHGRPGAALHTPIS